MDLRPLLLALHGRGHPIVLPQTPPRGAPLLFRSWHPGSAMIRERFGTFYPDGPLAAPGVVFVPLVGFDRTGARLGYGGGYYDRTLAALPGVLAIGYGHAAQEVPAIPTEPHDWRLPIIVTEREIIRVDPGPPAAR
jgi:5-formyltetrahydrofolate cyclo-ligase